MVLGTAGIGEDGDLYLSDHARSRCDRAAEAYFGHDFSRTNQSILIAGGYAKWLFDEPPVSREAHVMAEYLIKTYGIPETAFLLEDQSTNTEENFILSHEKYPDFFEDIEHYERKLAVVSHENHLERAVFIGRQVLNCYERQLVPLAARQMFFTESNILSFEPAEDRTDIPLAASGDA